MFHEEARPEDNGEICLCVRPSTWRWARQSKPRLVSERSATTGHDYTLKAQSNRVKIAQQWHKKLRRRFIDSFILWRLIPLLGQVRVCRMVLMSRIRVNGESGHFQGGIKRTRCL